MRLGHHVFVLAATLALAPAAAQANLLLNGSLEATVTVKAPAGGFPVPAPPDTPDFEEDIGFQHWAASAYNRLGGVDVCACPAVFAFGCTGKGNWVATVNSTLPKRTKPVTVPPTTTRAQRA